MEEKKKMRLLERKEKELEKKIDSLTKRERGYGRTVEKKVISPDITPLNFDTFGINNVLSIQDTLFNIRGKDKLDGDKINDLIYSDIYNKKDQSESMNAGLRHRLKKNTEYNYIMNNMTEMRVAVDQLADDVVFPNSALQTGINIDFIGSSEKSGERYDDLIKFFRPRNDITAALRSRRVYNFDIETQTKELVKNLAIYGYQIACTIPYKSIVTDLLFNADKNKNGKVAVSESDIIYEDMSALSESLLESYSSKRFSDLKMKGDELRIPNISFFKDTINNLNSLFITTPYSESDVDNLIEYMTELEQENEIINETQTKLKPATSVMDLFNPINESDILMDELKKKKNKKFIIDNINGCSFEFLDINKVHPIFIKDQLVGAYVLDVVPSSSKYKLGNNMSNMINASNLDENTDIPDAYKKKIRSTLFGDIAHVLERNINKTFLRNNPNLIEDIEWIMDINSENLDNILSTKIRFIPSEYLTLFKIGSGQLGQSMLEKSKEYAKMYIQLNKSEMVNKVFLNKQRMKIQVNDTGNISSQATISQAVISARNSIPRLSDIGIPDTMTDSILANYQSVLVHANPDGKNAVDVIPMDMVEPRDNSDFLRYLSNRATLPIGYPMDSIDPTQNIDFAKKISNINNYTMLKVTTMQDDITLALSELCTKRLKYMKGNNNLEVQIEFVRPKEINDNIAIDSLDRVMRKLEAYEMVIDRNATLKDEEKENMKSALAKKLLSEFLDMSLLDRTEEDVIIQGVNQ